MNIIITESQYRILLESQEEVDRILDKISDGSYESLSIDEKRYLDAFSKHTGRPDEFVDPSESYDDREGEKFTSSFNHIPKIEFVFDYEEQTENETALYGTILFKDKEYIGGLFLNKMGHLVNFDFYDINEEPESINDEVGRFQDDIEGMEYEVKMFFEDEVIPSLIN
jgi:hypothetical protein